MHIVVQIGIAERNILKSVKTNTNQEGMDELVLLKF